MLVSAPYQSFDRVPDLRSQHAHVSYSTLVPGPPAKDHFDAMTLSSSHANTALFAESRGSMTNSTTDSHDQSSPIASTSSGATSHNLAQPVPTRPKNHVRGVASDSRLWTTGRSFFEGRYRERQAFVSAQEQKDLEAERDAIQQIQNVQAAKRRAKMMRLTPAFPSVPRESAHTPSPPSSEASSARTASEADLSTPPDNRLAFPSPKTRLSMAANQNGVAPIHPASRKALALKANSPGPEVLGGLSLDLHCLPSPAGDRSSISSTASASSELVRKKSGEPVKSSLKQYSGSYIVPRSASAATFSNPSYGAKSVPTTPSAMKTVHFDTQLEHIKIFKTKGRPQAVSREASPEHTETETEEERDYPWFGSRRGGGSGRQAGHRSPVNPTTPEALEADEQLVLRLPNFPSSAKLSLDKDIFLERIYLSDDLRSVRGTVQVKNLSFEKWVAVRFTLDHWATVNEVSAEYSESIKEGAADRFVFSIKLNEVLNWPRGAGLNETKTIFLCLRYTTGGREIWDNNDDGNYQLDFRKRPVQPAEATRMPPSSTDAPRASPSSFGNTAPRRYTLGSMGPSATSSIIEMGRRTGVYGQKATRDHAMERLKQELERLRSDEEEADKAPASADFITELAKRRSPPVSPGGAGKPGSPSMWSARYDFGASLRDPTSGSRKTEAGRAAALDYFSARPAAVAATSPMRSSFVVSAATPSPDGSTPRSAAELVPKFGRLGMLSPGLGEMVVEHPVVSSSNTSSPSGSLLQVPQVGTAGLFSPDVPVSPSPSASARYHSFPPSRNMQSFGAWDEELHNGLGSGSASGSGSANGSRSGTPPSPLGFSSSRIAVKSDGLVLEDYTPDGSQASPNSMTNSPNPFSPPLSASSIDSDSTAMVDANGKSSLSTLADSLDNLGNVGSSSSYRFLRADQRPSSYAAGDDAEQHGYSSSALSSTTLSPSSELATPDEEFMRPSNLTSFNELVARYCWNSDNQVPQASPEASALMPQTPHTPTSTSGRSTPIARAGGAY
ncbi:putative phosphatase regulatory subunit [Kalmanozyma brasiliensis GHG001]|uniref:CBM21 domain-containing protein n=1 Tax=Kalmanozyma brasiliensis (strain GHG001) TaxID=1365824 RepID=V5ENA8_KALBG|nr:putative phosphatase regulatory subunit [Kalmanozyma brasiliensis GHG001]EST06560.1 putative phosphatase regulatory subunit [Kalmanozyma brasiliensis GHG001]